MPKTLESLELEDYAKLRVEEFILEWAHHFQKLYLISDVDKIVGSMIGEQYQLKLKEFKQSLDNDVLSHLEKLKRFGHRGQTSAEIIAHFKDIHPRSVARQLERLLRSKQIKQLKVIVGNHKAIFYEAK